MAGGGSKGACPLGQAGGVQEGEHRRRKGRGQASSLGAKVFRYRRWEWATSWRQFTERVAWLSIGLEANRVICMPLSDWLGEIEGHLSLGVASAILCWH